jgi:hypothetical protein
MAARLTLPLAVNFLVASSCKTIATKNTSCVLTPN